MWFRLWDTALFNLDFLYFIMGIPMNQQVWDQELLRKLWGHGGGERSKLEYLGVEVQFRTRFIPDLVSFCLVCMFFSNRTMFNKKVSLSQAILLGLWGNIYIYMSYIIYTQTHSNMLYLRTYLSFMILTVHIYKFFMIHDVYTIFVYCFHAKSVSICNIYRVWSCYVRICIYI